MMWFHIADCAGRYMESSVQFSAGVPSVHLRMEDRYMIQMRRDILWQAEL